jgi:type IV secretion system protein VirB11
MTTIAHRDGAYVESERRRRVELARVLGATIGGALADPNVVEIMVNPDGAVWIDQLIGGMIATDLRLTAWEVEDAIATIASELGTTVDASSPTLQGELPLDGSRVQAFLPPATEAPALIIRKRAARVIPLDDYVDDGILAPSHRRLIHEAVRDRRNLLIAGSTGSGKTTFANGILDEVAALTPRDRLILLEDTRELQCPSPNKLFLRKSAARSLTQLLQDTLRSRPERIVFGEVRDGSAHDFLMALNTGHGGSFTTIHANGAYDALLRLEDLVQLAGVPAIPRAIARAIHLIVFLVRTGDQRRVSEFAVVDGVSRDGEYQLHFIDSEVP